MGLHKRSASCCRPSTNITPKNVQQKLWFRALVSSRHVRRKNQSKRDKIGSFQSNISFMDDKQIFDHGKYTRFSEKRFIENSLDLINRPDVSAVGLQQFVDEADNNEVDAADHSDHGDDSSSDSKLHLAVQDAVEITDDCEESDSEESSNAKIVHLRSSPSYSCPLDLQHSQSSDSDSDTFPFYQSFYLSEMKLKQKKNHTPSSDNSLESLHDVMETSLDKNCDISSCSNAVFDESMAVIKLEENKRQRISRDEKMSKIFAFNIPEKNQIVLLLQHPAEIVIKGISWIKVISGSVTVYGYHLNSTEPAVSLFSLKKFGNINISTSPPELRTLRSSKKNIASELKAITGMVFTRIKNVLTHSSVVLLVEPAKVLKGRVEYALTHIGENYLPSFSRHPEEIQSCGLSISLVSASTKLACNINEEWLHLANIIHDAYSLAIQEGSFAPRVVVCGGKNSGKSTLLRYLMNMILNLCSNCYHLEADIGQTEFSPPGCISLTCVNKPLFGPPFTHLKEPEKMYFLGAPSVKIPDDYLCAFTDAFEYYTQHQQKMPLFVNTMGWTKDLGMLLLMDILHIVQPTHVIQINFEDSRKGQNFHSLTTQFVYETNGWRFMKSTKELQQYHLIEISSVSHTGHSSGSFTPAENRDLATLSYLGQLQAAICLEFLPINTFAPYVVPWSAVAVYVYHHTISQKQVLFALNATWVALCKVHDAKVLEGNDEMPKMLTSVRSHECLGFGIIRGIDSAKKLFYIITPEPLRRLRLVNALVRGSVNLPERLLTAQDVKCLPYFEKEATL